MSSVIRALFPEINQLSIDDLDSVESLDDFEFDFERLADEMEALGVDFDTIERLKEETLFDLMDRLDEEQLQDRLTVQDMDIVHDIRKLTPEEREELEEMVDLSVGFDGIRGNMSDLGVKAMNQGKLNDANEVVFTTRRDDRVCPICEDLDGDVYPVDPLTGIIEGPLIPDDTHPNCRCTYTTLEDTEEIE